MTDHPVVIFEVCAWGEDDAYWEYVCGCGASQVHDSREAVDIAAAEHRVKSEEPAP